MEKKRTITFYKDMNGPDRELLQENARKSPEECPKDLYDVLRIDELLKEKRRMGEADESAKRVSTACHPNQIRHQQPGNTM